MSIGIRKTFNLDMVPGGAPPIIHVSAGDVGRPFRANLLYNGETYDLEDVTSVKIRGTKPDNTVFEYDLTFDVDDSHVDFVIEEQMAIIAGQVLCEIRLFSGDDTIGSANFILDVEQNCFDPVIRLIDSGTYTTTYGTWNYKIYSDGTAECFGRMVLSTTSSTASGSGYYSDKISIPTPFTFDSSHSTIHGSMGSQTYLANPEVGEGYIGFRIMRLTSGTISDSTCRFYVRGRVYNYPNFNYTAST